MQESVGSEDALRMLMDGKVKIIGAYYDIESGEITSDYI